MLMAIAVSTVFQVRFIVAYLTRLQCKVSVLDLLKPYCAFNAEFNSREREDQQASICADDTREGVLNRITQWAENETDHTHPICWLYGPAGTGKSSIAHTIAEKSVEKGWVVLTFFFSRGRKDRTAITKVFTTLSYRLAASNTLPSARQTIGHAIQEDPSILLANFQTQFQKLVADPIMAGPQSMPKVIIIIDGLDECQSFSHQKQLVKLLVRMSPSLSSHVKFLVASRPEEQIKHEFHVSAAQSITELVHLYDFDATDDIRKVCVSGFEEIAKRYSLQRGWPSDVQIQQVVLKSEGIFIYISTLLRFVGQGGGDLPQEKLSYALQAHAGLDGIYHQVFKLCQGKNLWIVITAILLIRQPLTIMDLGELLGLGCDGIRYALEGTRSVLNIPDKDDDVVVPYHASLGDFIRDGERSKVPGSNPHKNLFGSLAEQHGAIMNKCMELVISGMEKEGSNLDGIYSTGMKYACQNWSFHLSAFLASPNGLASIQSHINPLKGFLVHIKGQYQKQWLVSLGDIIKIQQNKDDMQHVYNLLKVNADYPIPYPFTLRHTDGCYLHKGT